MAEQNTPNDASRKSKAEGERWSRDSESAGDHSGYANTGDEASGITNRPLDEEISNQQSLPDRGESRPGAHAGHGDNDVESERSER